MFVSKKTLAVCASAIALTSVAAPASAHLVTFGWKDNGNGTVTLYGEHWHGDMSSPYSANGGIHITPAGGGPTILAQWSGVTNNTDVTAMNLTGYTFNVGNSGGGTYDDWFYTAPIVLGNGLYDFFTGTNCCIDTMYNSVRIQVTGITSVPPGTIGGAVPEPATWAMMLLGFGAMGSTIRRRRQKMAISFA